MILQVDELKKCIEEEHRKRWGPDNLAARGYADAVLQSMWDHFRVLYGEESPEFTRIKSVLRNTGVIHNRVKKYFPDGKCSSVKTSLQCRV